MVGLRAYQNPGKKGADVTEYRKTSERIGNLVQ
jgi:hypothetical protein